MDNLEKNNPPISSPKKLDTDIFDTLKILSGINDMSDEVIRSFRDNRVKERFRKFFDSQENMRILIAIDNLPPDEFEKLKRLAIEKDAILPGIHKILTVFGTLLILTGDDNKYKLER